MTQRNHQTIELNLIFTKTNLLLGQTIALQDITSYSKRDYKKPFRDPSSGMLPPKLAQIMINMGIPPPQARRGLGGGGETTRTIYDPFCGSGTILTEALLMGYNVLGSDISQKAIESTKANITWLKQNFPINSDCSIKIFQKDARDLPLDVLQCTTHNRQLTLVTEPYLGPPLTKEPSIEKINDIQAKLKQLYLSFFEHLNKKLPPKTPIIIIFPYVKAHHKRHFLQITPQIENLGFTAQDLIPLTLQQEFKLSLNQFKSLLYERKDQLVGREIWKFTKI